MTDWEKLILDAESVLIAIEHCEALLAYMELVRKIVAASSEWHLICGAWHETVSAVEVALAKLRALKH